MAAEYIAIVTKQVRKLNTKFSTVYIGGGTPTVLGVRLLGKLLNALGDHLGCSCENTIEVNPESADKEVVGLLYSKGINRISIGMQSLREDKLKRLRRIHTVDDALQAVNDAKRGGFKNIGIDLIYGMPDEQLHEWKKELKEAASLPVTHISCYSLACERHTAFYRLRRTIDDELCAKMYRQTMQFLPRQGFIHYEVSNYAKSGFESRHNSLYWENSAYVGLGPSAVSYTDCVRTKNVVDVKEYIRRIRNNQSVVIHAERLSSRKRAKETAALNIRRGQGIDFEQFRQDTGYDFWQLEDISVIRSFLTQKILRYKRKGKEKTGLAFTSRGFLYADSVSSALL